ncbi:hypothetical protein GCM10023222_09020 [Saccharopolyspora cebuensis]
MTEMRIDLHQTDPATSRAMFALQRAAAQAWEAAGLDEELHELIKIRASQLNGCSFCLDMHTREGRARGVGEQRLDLVAVWWETDLYTPAERAALALAEAITKLSEHGVPDEVWDAAASFFDEAQLGALTWAATTINAWNRLGVTARRPIAPRE